MKLRLGLVGLSSDWTSRYVPALRVLRDRFEVVAVYNSVSALADRAAQEFEADHYDSFRELLARDDIDAAMMLEGGWYGTVPIDAACDSGKAVYCGNEIRFDPQLAAELKQRVDGAGIAFMAEFPRRYAPATLRLKELIATHLGAPQLLFCHHRLQADANLAQRRGSSKQSQIDEKLTIANRIDRELVELIDWCSFIAGNSVRSVQSTSHIPFTATTLTEDAETCGDFPDYQSLSVDLSPPNFPIGSTVAQISCGAYIPSVWSEAINFRPPAAIQVCCENGVAFLDLPNGLTWFDDAGRHRESLDAELSVGQQLLTQFHRAVTSLVRKMGDLEDVCRSLQTLDNAKRSARERRAIDMECSQ